MPVKPRKSRPRVRPPQSEPLITNESAANESGANESGTAIVAGLQEVGAEVTAYAESTIDQTMHLARSLIDAASLSDVIALQQKFAQANFAMLITGSARVAEIGLRMLSSAALPHEPPPDEAAG
jgi:hypothetical protein